NAVPNAAQDGWIAVRDDLHSFVSQIDYTTLSKLLQPKDQTEKSADDIEKMITAESKKFTASIEERLRSDMRDLAGCDGSQVNAFMAEYARQRKSWEITEDLDDEKFEISVDMPGQVVASNADQSGGHNAAWSIDGSKFDDAEVELIATSKVGK